MNTNKISIKTSNKNYSIVIGRDLIGKIDKILKANRLKFDKCLNNKKIENYINEKKLGDYVSLVGYVKNINPH